ncbi:MAG TPA: hypothetical protein VN428_19665, partial [Bryobacteraceae bacterium]|nr:hypothetical protein [Bryobacteraceae bacterium]
YQTAKREVTAVAIDGEGAIWAAAVGTRQGAGAPAAPPAPATVAVSPTPANPAGPAAPQGARMAVPPPAAAPITPASIPGGSEVYRITREGFPKRAWTNAQDVVYALGFDRAGRPLAGTGNKGKVYRLDSDLVSTELINTPPSQVTAILAGRGGRIWAATGNVGKVYRIGPELAKSGSAESEVFDAGLYSKWGRLTWRGQANGGRVTFATRSGNLDRPQTDWSAWSAEITELHGAPTASPASRFVQWRADLTAAADGRSPVLNAVDVAYLPHNVAPVVSEIETTPPNYRFPPASPTLTSTAQTLSLPALGGAPRPRSRSVSPAAIAPALQAAHGFVGARWAASDENGDTLTYAIYIRGENETSWKLLAEKLAAAYYSWDSTAFPDGDYRVRVVASDMPDNPAGQALTAESVSEPFTIDNTPPVITGLSVTPAGNNLAMKWNARDALSVVEKAEYSINGSEWALAPPVSGVSDSREEEYSITVERPAPGELTIAVRVTDEFDNRSVAKTVLK